MVLRRLNEVCAQQRSERLLPDLTAWRTLGRTTDSIQSRRTLMAWRHARARYAHRRLYPVRISEKTRLWVVTE